MEEDVGDTATTSTVKTTGEVCAPDLAYVFVKVTTPSSAS